MAKKTIKLSESQLRNMVAESIKKVLKEDIYNDSTLEDIIREKMKEYRMTYPEDLSDYELKHAIEYMLAYRRALGGDEDVLHEYIEEAKRRNLPGV